MTRNSTGEKNTQARMKDDATMNGNAADTNYKDEVGRKQNKIQ